MSFTIDHNSWPPFTKEQYDAEYAQFRRSPDWELQNIFRALNTLRILNTAEDEARLAAVREIRKERRAARKTAKKKGASS